MIAHPTKPDHVLEVDVVELHIFVIFNMSLVEWGL
jgi:hypothetical protein